MLDTNFIQERLSNLRRIVIKVGTNLLRGNQEGLNLVFMNRLAAAITDIKERGIDVILVSSGAVGAGAYVMGYSVPPSETEIRQALAAIGQSRLMHHYKGVFKGYNVNVAQVLLTSDALDNRQRYLNARNTLETLLGWKVLPIINENDTVAIEELRFGDNDRLSALIAGKIDADLLILMTDVNGLYDRPPTENGATQIPILFRNDFSHPAKVDGPSSGFSLGGMRSKLEAVRLATQAGILAHIAPGDSPGVLARILAGEMVGTWCEPQERKISARKRWLVLGKRWGGGKVVVDPGAEEALLKRGRSLLPSGVEEVVGNFRPGDLVVVLNSAQSEIARGLVQYSSAELNEVLGMKTKSVDQVLGKRQNYEVIHRDDLVLLDEE